MILDAKIKYNEDYTELYDKALEWMLDNDYERTNQFDDPNISQRFSRLKNLPIEYLETKKPEIKEFLAKYPDIAHYHAIPESLRDDFEKPEVSEVRDDIEQTKTTKSGNDSLVGETKFAQIYHGIRGKVKNMFSRLKSYVKGKDKDVKTNENNMPGNNNETR